MTVAAGFGLLSATGAWVSGYATTTLTITGSLAQVNASLATLQDISGAVRPDTITIHVTDSAGGNATPATIAVAVTASPAQLPPSTRTPPILTTGVATLAAEFANGYTVQLQGTDPIAPPAIDITAATIGSSGGVQVGDASGAARFGQVNVVGYAGNYGTLAAQGAAATTHTPSTLTVTIKNAVDALGNFVHQGVLNNAGTIAARDGGSVSITGDATAKLINAGTIASAGLLFIGEAVTGTGTMTVAAGGRLELGASVSTGQAITQSAGGALVLDDIKDFSATIFESLTGGRILFGSAQPQPDAFTYSNGRLDLFAAGTAIGALHVHRATGSAIDSGSFQLTAATAGQPGYLQVTPHGV